MLKEEKPIQEAKNITSFTYVSNQIAKAVHLFSMAYIVGQSFSIFNLGAVH